MKSLKIMSHYFYVFMLMLLLFTSCEKSPTTPDTPQYPTIHSFSSSVSELARGKSCTLSWNVSNATKVEIDNGIGQVPLSGSQEVSPTSTTTYTLTATNNDGQREATCKIEIIDGAILVMTQGPKWKETEWTFAYFGIVKNNGTWKAEFVKVYIYLYNKNGGLIDTKFSYVDKTNISPGEKSSWEVSWWDDDKSIRKKIEKSKTEYEIEWSEYDFLMRTGKQRVSNY